MLRRLWSAMDALRGEFPFGECVDLISNLLVLRFLSERKDELEGEFGFTLPKGAEWADVASGKATIQEVTQVIEAKNEGLSGIFTPGEIIGSRWLESSEDRSAVLKRVINELGTIQIRGDADERFATALAHEALIRGVAESESRRDGEYVTPEAVSDLLVELVDPRPGQSLCDPAAGAGTTLTRAIRRASASPGLQKLDVAGQELNPFTWKLCRRNLLLHGYLGAQIALGDTLRSPGLFGPVGGVRKFDRVVCQPPWGMGDWGADEAAMDPFGRFSLGVPPRTKGDFAWVQHALSILKPEGVAAILLPQGVLFRGGEEGAIRRGLVKADLVVAVIGLTGGVFASTAIPTCVIVLAKKKSSVQKGRILFLDTGDTLRKNTLGVGQFEGLADQLRTMGSGRYPSRAVPIEEVEAADFNLQLNRYLEKGGTGLGFDPAATLERIRTLDADRDLAEHAIGEALHKLGL